MKRLFDFTSSLLGILILSPIIIVIALFIRINMGSPVIFKQTRPGFKGKPFYIYKFRTMTNETDGNGNLLPNHKRITSLGKLLRKTSLDELPQLFNVIKGDISLVGPRPLLMEYLELYSPEQARRHDVRPGITGWAQINGRNAVTWEERFKLDIWYVDHQSFWLDIKILFMTIFKVFRAEGVNQSEQMTMHRFTGNKKVGSDNG